MVITDSFECIYSHIHGHPVQGIARFCFRVVLQEHAWIMRAMTEWHGEQDTPGTSEQGNVWKQVMGITFLHNSSSVDNARNLFHIVQNVWCFP